MIALASPHIDAPSTARFEPAIGIHRNVPPDIYHSWDAVSSSCLKALIGQSPAHALDQLENPTEPTPALRKGDATHALVLQPSRFEKEYVVADGCSAVKKDGRDCHNPGKYLVGGNWLCGVHVKKDRYDQILDAIVAHLIAEGCKLEAVSQFNSHYFTRPDGTKVRVSDHQANARTLRWMLRERVEEIRVDLAPHGKDDPRIVVASEDFDACVGMRDSVLAHPKARKILDNATDIELSIVWRDAVTGLLCKARIDILCGRHGIVGDLKTTRCSSPGDFTYSAYDLGYHIQMAFYLHALQAFEVPVDAVDIIAVENERPFATTVFEPDSLWLEAGEVEFRRGLQTVAQCKSTGKWPAYSERVETLSLPRKAMTQIGLLVEE